MEPTYPPTISASGHCTVIQAHKARDSGTQTDEPGRPTDRRQRHGTRAGGPRTSPCWRHLASRHRRRDASADEPLPLLCHWQLPTSTAVAVTCRPYTLPCCPCCPQVVLVQSKTTRAPFHPCRLANRQGGDPNQSTNKPQHGMPTSNVIAICISRPPESQLVACTEEQARHCVPPSSSHGGQYSLLLSTERL